MVASIGKIVSPLQSIAYHERDSDYAKDDLAPMVAGHTRAK